MADGVVITGRGVISALPSGAGALFDALCAGECGLVDDEATSLGETVRTRVGRVRGFDPEAWIADETLRRMSRFTQYAIAAGKQAACEAGLIAPGPAGRFAADSPMAERTAVVCAAVAGSPPYVLDYYAPIIERGVVAANPLLFGEGVPNAASSHLSMSLGIRGGCQTLLGDRTVGIEAIVLAAEMVRAGRYDVVLAGASEEYHPVLTQIHEKIGMHAPREKIDRGCLPFAPQSTGYLMGEGAALVVVERESGALRRGAKPLARLRAAGMSTGAGSAGRRSEAVEAAILSLLGCGTGFQPVGVTGYKPVPHGMSLDRLKEMVVFSSANGSALDAEEVEALRRTAGSLLTVTSLAGAIGECLAMTPVASVIAAIEACRQGRCPPTRTTDPWLPEGLFCPQATTPIEVSSAVVLATGFEGASAALRIDVM
jgi:3-oxoacyl-[acyl-carrier-protein] synthase II